GNTCTAELVTKRQTVRRAEPPLLAAERDRDLRQGVSACVYEHGADGRLRRAGADQTEGPVGIGPAAETMHGAGGDAAVADQGTSHRTGTGDQRKGPAAEVVGSRPRRAQSLRRRRSRRADEIERADGSKRRRRAGVWQAVEVLLIRAAGIRD